MQIEIRNCLHNYLTSITTINDFVDRAHETMEYNYDFNGNMIEDKNKAITVKYNLQNLPVLVDWGKGRKIEWLYSADGTKLRKNVYDNGHLNTITDYANGFEYETVIDPNAAEGTVPVPELQSFAMSEGRIVNVGGTLYYNYHLKDHLGNVRVTLSNESGAPKITGRNFYYPFGLRIATTLSNPENKYLYNGKELEDDHGLYWYHYGARYYDPQLGRWHTMDPADEFNSPYLYVGNNPVMLVDPDGRQVETLWFQWIRDLFSGGNQIDNDYKDAPSYSLDEVVVVGNRIDPTKERGVILTIGFGASGAGGTGGNYFLGLNINTNTGFANFYAKWGLSAGYGGTAGLSGTVYRDYTIEETNGYGSRVNPSKNSYDFKIGRVEANINPSKHGIDAKGFSYDAGIGAYYGFDFSFQSSRSRPFNLFRFLNAKLIY